MKPKDLTNLGALAAKMIHRYPETQLPSGVRVRLAEVFLSAAEILDSSGMVGQSAAEGGKR